VSSFPLDDHDQVAAHPDGSIWVATNTGLARIEPDV